MQLDLNKGSRSFLAKAAITSAAVIGALGLTELLWLIFDRPISAPLFLAAIVLSSATCGWRWGVVATITSAFTIDFFFIPPVYQFAGDFDEIARLTVFSFEGTILSWMTDVWLRSIAELRRSEDQLRALTVHQQSLREEEQKRISLEIHDELGQALTGLKMEVHYLIRSFNDGELPRSELTAKLAGLNEQIDSTISTIRRIATEIRPSILDDFGLIAAIEWQANEFARRSGIECTFTSEFNSIETRDPDIEISVYRIVQEALTNISRHAKASRVDLNISSTEGNTMFTIKDDGVGFDLTSAAKRRSLGLLGMHERARLIGATVDILNGSGTTVIVTLPGDHGETEVASA